jgi:serine/threonine protein kinase
MCDLLVPHILLKHDHVVELHGFMAGQSPTLGHSLVLELMGAATLREILDDRTTYNSIAPATRVRWLKQVAQGMRFMHSRTPEICHHDLSVSAILLSGENPLHRDSVAKIYKLGTRKQALEDPSAELAPEVLKSSSFSTKSDVWAFGQLTLYVVHRGTPVQRHHNNTDTTTPSLPLASADGDAVTALPLCATASADVPASTPCRDPFSLFKLPRLKSLVTEECLAVEASRRPTFHAICDELCAYQLLSYERYTSLHNEFATFVELACQATTADAATEVFHRVAAALESLLGDFYERAGCGSRKDRAAAKDAGRAVRGLGLYMRELDKLFAKDLSSPLFQRSVDRVPLRDLRNPIAHSHVWCLQQPTVHRVTVECMAILREFKPRFFEDGPELPSCPPPPTSEPPIPASGAAALLNSGNLAAAESASRGGGRDTVVGAAAPTVLDGGVESAASGSSASTGLSSVADTELANWLRGIDCEDCIDVLREQGYMRVGHLKGITAKDLKELDIKQRQAKSILNAVQKLL